jgi:threonine dehydratase
LTKVINETGAIFIPPYNDFRIVCGQATVALELLNEIKDLDCVIAPVGGGGLLSGTAISVSSLSPGTQIFGAEPQNADDAYQSFHAGRIIKPDHPDTIADGLRTSLGDLTFSIIREFVTDILTVSEADIVSAMRLIWERMKIIVEPSAAVSLAAVLQNSNLFREKRVGIIVSGGNCDLDNLPWMS